MYMLVSSWIPLTSFYMCYFSTKYIFMHKVSVSKARAIVVLAEEGNADQVSFADQATLFLKALPYIIAPFLAE